MFDINIYKSINNGSGGEISQYGSDLIFKDSDYSCIYIKNDSLKPKRILGIKNTSSDEIFLSVLKKDGDIVVNKISELSDTNSLVFTEQVSINFVLPPSSFITVWYKKGQSLSAYNLKKQLNIVVEWVDEY